MLLLHGMAMLCRCPLEGEHVALGSLPGKSVGLPPKTLTQQRDPGKVWGPVPSFYSQACMGITNPGGTVTAQFGPLGL